VILAVGKMVDAAGDAAELLEARGVEATVWDVRVFPLDARMLNDARRHPLVVTAEDGIAEGGIGTAIASALARMDGLGSGVGGGPSPPVMTLGTPLAYLPHGKPADLLANLGLDGPGIAASVSKALDGRA
jgi:1-deoxy-D-xylulose-5-phosphate synthase